MKEILLILHFIGLVMGLGTRFALAGDFEAHMKKVAPLGSFSMLVGIAIVSIAVYIFY